MRLLDLAIFRVREIEQLRLNFGEKQLVALLGENGSGKTTLLGSIIWLLCGEVIFKGGKDRMIRDVGSGDSWVAGTIRQGDHEFKLKRFISSSACELVYTSGANQKPIKTPTKVQLELDKMGLTKEKVMRTLLEQGRYGGMFHSNDGDRLRLMFEIFGLTDTEEIQEAIGAEAALIPVDVTIDDRWHAAEDKLKATDLALSSATIEKAAVSSRFDAITGARKVLAKAIEAEAAAAELNKLRGGRDAAARAVDALTAEVTCTGKEQAGLDAAVSVMAADLVAAQGVVTAMNTYRALAAGVDAYTVASVKAGEAVERHRVQLSDLEVFDDAAVAKLRGEITALQADIHQRENTVAAVKRLETVKAAAAATFKKKVDLATKIAFLPGNLAEQLTTVDADLRDLREQVALAKSGVCPTCKQKLPTAHECLPLSTSEPLLANCEARRGVLAAQAKERDIYFMGISTCDTLLAEYAGQIKAANVADVDILVLEGQIAAARSGIAERELVLNRWSRVAADRAALGTKLATATAEFNAAQAYLTRVDAAKVDPGVFDAAAEFVKAYEDRKQRAAVGRGLFAAQVTRLGTLKTELDAVEAKIKGFTAIDAVDQAAVEAARAVVASSAEIEALWLGVNTQHGIAESEQRTAAQEFSTLDVLKRQNESNLRKHALVNDIKLLVGVKQFPMYVAGFYVQAINALWSRELEIMDTKFSAWQDETSLEFYATFHGTDQTRMLYQLSGGERQLASVGYQVVINRLFAAGVDWIAFDEPTTHVDAAYRPKLIQAFLRMMQREELKDTQMFVVDHCVEFANAISDPIILSKGE